jgi:transposase
LKTAIGDLNRPGIPGDSTPWKRGWSHEEKRPTKRYPPEFRERAMKMVQELQAQDPRDKTVISRVARQLGAGSESLPSWVKQAEVGRRICSRDEC